MLKVAVIGGGSTYTPELVNGFLARTKHFPLDELWLMDSDADRLTNVGEFAQRMVARQRTSFSVCMTTDRADALRPM